MSGTQHTPGLLVARGFSIYATDGKTPVADTCLNASVADHDTANAPRLVAAWNACDGVPTEEIEDLVRIGGLNALTIEAGKSYAEVAALKAYRDELVEALTDVIGWVSGPAHWHTDAPQKSVNRARALIAKHKGAV